MNEPKWAREQIPLSAYNIPPASKVRPMCPECGELRLVSTWIEDDYRDMVPSGVAYAHKHYCSKYKFSIVKSHE